MNHTFWLAVHPDSSKPIGGVKQIHRLAESLVELGHQAVLVQKDKSFHPGWFSSTVNTVSFLNGSVYSGLDPTANTIILPETFMPYINNYAPSIPKIIFNQNFSYTFGCRPGKDNFPDDPSSILKFYSHPSIRAIWCVSDHNVSAIQACLPMATSVKVSRIYNSVESDLFTFSSLKRKKLCFMPRKNSRDAKIIISILLSQRWFQGWKIVGIDNLPQLDVSKVFSECVGFLSTGHPEGFGLPLVEALATGNALFGYHGLGGREVFDLASTYGVGFPSHVGDWADVVSNVKSYISLFDNDYPSVLSSLSQASCQALSNYSSTSMANSVQDALASYLP